MRSRHELFFLLYTTLVWIYYLQGNYRILCFAISEVVAVKIRLDPLLARGYVRVTPAPTAKFKRGTSDNFF